MSKKKERNYVDRKGSHSMNTLVVAGPNLKFYYVKCNMPGSVNDSRVLFNSSLFDDFEAGYRPFPNCVLLGDSIYPAKPWLIPMRANANPQYNVFYSSHAKTRVIVERSIGLWKMRFLCLKKGLRVKDTTYSAEIIKACAYLHNFIIDNRTNEENDDDQFEEETDENDEPNSREENDNFGNDNQNALNRMYQNFIAANYN